MLMASIAYVHDHYRPYMFLRYRLLYMCIQVREIVDICNAYGFMSMCT